MYNKLILSSGAYREMEESILWYESRSKGL